MRALNREGCVWVLRLRNVQRFRGGLMFKAHKLLYHSNLGLRVIKKRRRVTAVTQELVIIICYMLVSRNEP